MAAAFARVAAVGEDEGIVGWTWRILNQDDVLVARAQVDVLWRRERTPAVAGAGAGGFWGDELGLTAPPL